MDSRTKKRMRNCLFDLKRGELTRKVCKKMGSRFHHVINSHHSSNLTPSLDLLEQTLKITVFVLRDQWGIENQCSSRVILGRTQVESTRFWARYSALHQQRWI